MENLISRWKKLTKEIRKYNKLYAAGIPLVTDDYYDQLQAELEHIESIIGQPSDSPLATVGADVYGAKVEHTEAVLSLDHGFGLDSIQLFFKRLEKSIYKPILIAEHKIDGISLVLRYRDRKLQQVLTRGNGKYGIDVTKQMLSMAIPRDIPITEPIEVRGEMYMTFATFHQLNLGFASPRNACASLVHSKSVAPSLQVQFAPHDITGIMYNTYQDQMTFLEQIGFTRIPHRIINNIDESKKYFEEIQNSKDQIEYPIDGIVLKLNDLIESRKLGSHRTAPRYAFAVKFHAISYITTIQSIEIQVGKFGTITPVAVFDSVTIDGQVITRASLHNIQTLYKNNYGSGDTIAICRSGDAIPYIQSKVRDAGNSIKVTHCPSCNSVLVEFEQTMRCIKSWECIDQRIARLNHFCSRNAFNISGLGEKNIQFFVENNFIYYPNDIFRLPEQIKSGLLDLTKFDGWSKKSVNNLIDAIEEAKSIDLARFLFAICIPEVGHGTAQTLAAQFDTWARFKGAFEQNEQIAISNIGNVITSSIKQFLQDSNNNWVEELLRMVIIK